jgi:hypothetical protein
MRRFFSKPKSIAFMCLISACGGAFADDSYFSVTSGIEHASGSYYSDRNVEEIYIPVTINYGNGSLGYRLTMPYLSVRAPAGTIITNSQGQVVVGEGILTTESGLGDIVAGITLYDVYVSKSRDWVVDASAKIKFGTADADKGLGTEENDYALQANIYKFFDTYYFNASFGYKFRGDPPGLNLNNVWYGSLGANYRFNQATKAGIAFDMRESSFAEGDAIQEISAFFSYRLDTSWSLQVYTFRGLSDSSPDWGGGAMVKYNL